MTVWPVLKNNLLGLLIACIISTIIVMGLTGRIAQALINYQDKKEEKFAGSVNEQTISEEVHDYE